MSNFDTKWGSVPEEIIQKSNFYVIIIAQFVVTLAILTTLQPPFVSTVSGDDFSNSKPSFMLIALVSVLCVSASIFMGDNLKNISNIRS